tara:strand:+ start:4857 stop:5033 length:177 start_codon:yes stop_codon:yes gene_type:complete
MMKYNEENMQDLARRVFDATTNINLQDWFIQLAVELYIADPEAFERDARMYGPEGGEE